MIDNLLSTIASHLCCNCRKVGTLLCQHCKKDILDEPFFNCLACGRLAGELGVCSDCKVPYERAWCVAERSDAVERLIDAYKFEYTIAAARSLAELLDGCLPQLPEGAIVVPIPTIPSHTRQRGYDHMKLVCRYFARRRGLVMQELLVRQHNHAQRGATRSQRLRQAESAFGCRANLNPDAIYLVVDDIVTTGATLYFGAKALKEAGAKNVWAAAIARQTLD